jgi:hypothetical protein
MITADMLERYVYLRDDGALVVQSMLDKTMAFEQRNLLLSCVEDNIWCGRDGERIDYEGAIRDFYEIIEARKEKG